MLEKSSTLLLTEEDLRDYDKGLVSERLKSTWDITFEELREYVTTNNYRIIKTNE